MIPASRVDRHSFATVRAVAIALDAPLDVELLRRRYPRGHEVTLVSDAGERRATLDDDLGDATFAVLGPVDPYEDLASVGAVTRIAERLRAADGCPWDREQTHASLRPHLLEEAYEVLAVLDSGDVSRLPEELGDLLFQVVIHAQLGADAGTFDMGDVARSVSEKLVRRHPHVFAGTTLASDDLLAQWERIKRQEKEHAGETRSITDGVPRELPALFAAERLQERAARVRIVPPRVELPLDVDDLEFLGDVLFDIVAEARERGFDAETALREANARFVARVKWVEEHAASEGRAIDSYAPDEMRSLWERSR